MHRSVISWRLCFCAILFGLLACGDDTMGPGTDAGDSGTSLCSTHAECDDGLFCTGEERCDPGSEGADPTGCITTGSPCMPTQQCVEDELFCRTVCEVENDADLDGHDAIACGGDDCDDSDPDRNPSLAEICDPGGRDEDCDPSTFGQRDLDGDGVTSLFCCNGSSCGLDCNDNVRATNPGSIEVCNGADDDCDGNVDEGLRLELFRDADFDGVGAAGSEAVVCPGQPGYAAGAGDCDDRLASVRPTAPEICDSLDNDCDGEIDEDTVAVPWYVDRDGDGWGIVSAEDPSIESCVRPEGRAIRPGDCDDSDAQVSPESPERCNGRDDDCNGLADYALEVGDTEDDDGDGLADARCEADTIDCDDRDPDTNGAGSPELCDGRDNDCDDIVDEDAAEVSWYADVDGDGFGNAADAIESCTQVPGRVRDNTDCDDMNAATRPNASDACLGQPNIDDDCDGVADEGGNPGRFFLDTDRDGYGTGEPLYTCVMDASTAQRSGDCDDTDPRLNPDALDDCAGLPGVDDDCDGRTDESPATRTYYTDGDDDGYGAGAPMSGCTQPPGTVTRRGDCNDMDPDINPLVPDDCGGIAGTDDDCDEAIDEASVVTTYYRDADMDTFGDAADPTDACGAPEGFVSNSRDCDDDAESANPDGTEVCDDLLDNDCNGMTDCDDPECAGTCSTLSIVSGDDQSAPVHTLFAEEIRVRVEGLDGTPLPGRVVRFESDTLTPEIGVLRTTDGTGEASFEVRAGLSVGPTEVVFSSAGATPVSATLTGTARADGTLFSVTNGPRFNVITETPSAAWVTSGLSDYSQLASAPDGTLYAGWNGVLYEIDPEGRVTAIGFSGTEEVADGLLASEVQVDTRDLPLLYHATTNRLLFGLGVQVWAIDLTTGLIALVAGNGVSGDTGDGGPATDAQLTPVRGMAYTANGVLWISTRRRLRIVDLTGDIDTGFEAPTTGSVPRINTLDGFLAPVGDLSDDIYTTAACVFGTPRACILRVRPNGSYERIAGRGSASIDDGVALDVRIDYGPIVLLPDGDLLLTESSRDRIRRIEVGGMITTVVGTSDTPGDTGDDGLATSGLIDTPVGLAPWNSAEFVFIDAANDAIRAVW